MVSKSKIRAKQKVQRAQPTHEDRRARFVAEYLIDSNATQAAIRAGYSEKTAYSQGSRLLRDADVAARIAQAQQRVHKRLAERYEVTTDRITRELAKIGFANMADYGRVTSDGEFQIDLSDTPEDAFAAISSIKSRTRMVKVDGELVPEVSTELRLASKREALVDLGKATGLFNDGPDLTVPVRFIVQWGPDDEEQVA